MRKIIVDKKYNNKKLNTFLLDSFNGLNLNTIYKTLRKKDIKINGKRTNENVILKSGDEVQIFVTDDLLFSNTEDNNLKIEKNLDIVYGDKNILIVNKPSNIEVCGENSLTSILEKKYNSNTITIKPCHRLDRNTTGLILFAKNKKALDILLTKFKNKEIEKHYICRVYGIPKKSQATLSSYLFKDNLKSLVYISDTPKKGYLNIITSYVVLSSDKETNTSILDVNLHTGRTHQIRAHLAHIGHPIIGDGKYGINSINKSFHKRTQELCAYSLTFKFKDDSNNDILEYLNNKTFKIDKPFK